MKNSNIREKDVEKYWVRKFKERTGGNSFKYTSPARRSVPDRLNLWIPEGYIVGKCIFTEMKAPGKTWTEPQSRQRDKLIELGQEVYLVSTYEEADKLIDHLIEKYRLD